jgi:hypothetical protein
VEIWLNPGGKEKGGAEAEFLYDESWGWVRERHGFHLRFVIFC